MADLIRKMQEGHTVEDLDTVIDEVYEARGEYDSLDERLDDMEGGAPTPSTSIPAMDGTGSAGTADTYARGDHTHPSDTSKQNALSSAQLAAVNSGIDSTKVAQIETNKNNILSLLPTTYTKPTSATGIFLQSGGYCKIGNICLVCLRFSDSSEVAANTAIFSGLPLPVKDSTISADRILITVANNKNIEINVTSSGEIKLGGTALSGTNDITTAFVVYLAQS